MGSTASTLHVENWGDPKLKGLIDEVDKMHESIAEFQRLLLIEQKHFVFKHHSEIQSLIWCVAVDCGLSVYLSVLPVDVKLY